MSSLLELILVSGTSAGGSKFYGIEILLLFTLHLAALEAFGSLFGAEDSAGGGGDGESKCMKGTHDV